MDSGNKEEKPKFEMTPIGMMFDPMEQMRELLFGAAQRETDKELARLQARLDVMQQEFAARVEALDARLLELVRETEKDRVDSLVAIGDSLSELGGRIKAMSEKRDV